MSISPVKVQVRGPAALLAAVPYLLGFHPQASLVAVGLRGLRARVRVVFRYELPDPPSRAHADDIALHITTALNRSGLHTVAIIGAGTGPTCAPIRPAARPKEPSSPATTL